MASTIQVDKIQDTGGNTILSSNSTGTFTYEAASGANFTNLPVPTSGIAASAIDSGTLAIAQGGTGAATFAAAGLANTPAFMATMSGEQTLSDGTFTKLEFNSEIYDSGSTYDPSTNYRFTPAVAGKYFIFATIFGDSNTNYLLRNLSGAIYKNGSAAYYSWIHPETSRYNSASLQAIIDMNTTDYVECYGYMLQVSSATLKIEGSSQNCMFGAYKLIGA